MSRLKILLTYVIVDVLIVGGVLWAAFAARWPARQFLPPAVLLFILNGVWLVWMTVKNTPPGAG